MKKYSKKIVTLVAFVSIAAMALLASCNIPTPVTACHATGDPANPYEQITIDDTNLAEHLAHPNDLYPVPVGGCPNTVPVVENEKITICHATSSNSNPYEEIEVSVNGLNGHGTHVGDIIPAPVSGCPTSPLVIVDDKISICHVTGDAAVPYEQIEVSVNGLDGHVMHEGDIVPAPANGCPTTLLVATNEKITICHATGDDDEPYDQIKVSVNGLNGHGTHEDDIVPAPVNGCPTTPLVVVNETTAICHATGDAAVPYEKIEVSLNGLDGHVLHQGDIIPAPEAGCPTTLLVVTVDEKITICHATDDDDNPYDEITVSVNGLNGHGAHEGDIVPAPVNGCPTTPLVVVDEKVTICHATDDDANPYDEIEVMVNGLDGHGTHVGDIVPAPVNGCPTSPLVIVDEKITICHATDDDDEPYDQIEVSVNGLNGHGTHVGDIVPAPVNGCPTTPLVVENETITICHATGNNPDPYDEIEVRVNGLDGHDTHVGDIVPAPEGGCPTTLWPTTNGKITICHATGSKKNPYNLITVSINGLNGHGKHAGDIIPAPGNSCPAGIDKNKKK